MWHNGDLAGGGLALVARMLLRCGGVPGAWMAWVQHHSMAARMVHLPVQWDQEAGGGLEGQDEPQPVLWVVTAVQRRRFTQEATVTATYRAHQQGLGVGGGR